LDKKVSPEDDHNLHPTNEGHVAGHIVLMFHYDMVTKAAGRKIKDDDEWINEVDVWPVCLSFLISFNDNC
jgi:hypothetical protein